MQVTQHTSQKLVLEDRPTMIIIGSYAIVGVGIILMLTNLNRAVVDFYLIMGLILMFAGLLIQTLFGDTSVCVFDKESQQFHIRRNRMIFQRFEASYAMANISKIRIENKGTRFRIAVQVSEDQWMPLSLSFRARELSEFERAAGKIQQFLAATVKEGDA